MRSSFSRLFIIKSPIGPIEKPLEKNSLYLGRSDENWNPDIDLGQLCGDFRVSKKHAHLFFKDGNWWIEDLGSKHGTLVDGEEVKGLKEPTKLLPGVPVAMGDSIWWIDPPNLFRKYQRDLIIEYQRVPAINYALYHCGIPLISNFRVRNRGSSESLPINVTISIPGYSNLSQNRFNPLPPNGEAFINKIHLELHHEILEGLDEKRKENLEIRLNGQTIVHDKISILGFYEWPFDPAFRKSLACFIQPAHPIVQHLILDSIRYLKEAGRFPSFTHLLKSDPENKVDYAIRAIYECLKEKYHIHYVFQAPSREPESQVIRPPHRILPGILRGGNAGEGTCIDLSLLMASCLENIHFQPIIVFVKENKNARHAFLGCWSEITERYEPVIEDYKKLENAINSNRRKLYILETTGFTDRWEKKVNYEEAVKIAFEKFKPEEFLFALDVAAARQTVTPLQFPMNPEVTGILRKAEEMAMKEKGNLRMETRHLFYGLLLEGGEKTKEILRKSKINLSLTKRVIPRAEREEAIPIKPTINYHRCLEDARFIAEDNGEKFVGEEHLFYALLLSQSKRVDDILEDLGTNRKIVKGVLQEMFDLNVSETVYELS